MKRIVIFGTGGNAERVVNAGGDIYDIVAFLDNNPVRQGTHFHQRPVLAPDALPGLDYEEIVIASMWHDEIRNQLIEQHGIAPGRIRRMPKAFASQGKRYHPFEDEATRTYAARVLRHVCDFLEQRQIACYVDHGTLLGLVRDDCIMPWDDDIDLSVAQEDRLALYACAPDLLQSMPDADVLEWRAEIVYNSIDEEVALFLFVDDPAGERNAFNVGLSFFRKENGLAIEAINWAPAHFYQGGEWIETALGTYRAPDQPRAYLALHYGAWETPQIDMAFADIDNFKAPEAIARWLKWDTASPRTALHILQEAHAAPIHGARLCLPQLGHRAGMDPLRSDPQMLQQSLDQLADLLYVDIAVICGLDDALNAKAVAAVIERLRHNGMAGEVVLEWAPPAAVPEALAQLAAATAVRICPPVVARKRAPAALPVGTAPRTWGAVKQFRCPHKRTWMLWNRWLAHCPRALDIALRHGPAAAGTDLLNLDQAGAQLKPAVLQLLRQRPCFDHEHCSAAPEVWYPFTSYSPKNEV
jgi:lipopolysaccharide cholinephosphotransferase